MINSIKSLGYVQEAGMYMAPLVKGLLPLVQYIKKLSHDRLLRQESVLLVGDDVITKAVVQQLLANKAFQHLGNRRKHCYWAIRLGVTAT